MPTAGSNERPWPGWWRSALGRRYAAVFALLVSLPLLAYAAWSAAQVYRQQRDALLIVTDIRTKQVRQRAMDEPRAFLGHRDNRGRARGSDRLNGPGIRGDMQTVVGGCII